MAPRLQLQALLVNILGSGNVYFQPPPSINMKYPAIVYKQDAERSQHADNKPYSRRLRYQITIIDRDPDSIIPSKIAALPTCVYDRFYAVDNLNHDVYNLFF